MHLIRTIILLIALAIVPGASFASERVALVIGNSDYAFAGKLPNPRNDSADIAASLKRLGFEVTVAQDASYAQLRQSLGEFSRKALGAEMAMIFYAGHGMEVNKQNYLIPTDAKLETDLAVAYEAIPLDLATEAVSGARGLKLVILDACRNNPFMASMKKTNATRSIGRGLARIEPVAGTLVAYSSKEGTVADDGSGRNSPYTKALLKYLEKPGLELRFLFAEVRDTVMKETDNRQQPFTYGSLGARHIYLREGESKRDGASDDETARLRKDLEELKKQLEAKLEKPSPKIVEKRTNTESADTELAMWNRVRFSKDVELLRSYIKLYPSGRFKTEALQLIKQHTPKNEQSAPEKKETKTASLGRPASDPRRTARHSNWFSYVVDTEKGRICYSVSTPVDKKPSQLNHGQIVLMLNLHPDSDSIEPQFIAGYELSGDPVTLSVGGKDFKMYTRGNSAWLDHSRNEKPLIEALKAGSRATIAAKSKRGTVTSYAFSLSGVTASLRDTESCL